MRNGNRKKNVNLNSPLNIHLVVSNSKAIHREWLRMGVIVVIVGVAVENEYDLLSEIR